MATTIRVQVPGAYLDSLELTLGAANVAAYNLFPEDGELDANPLAPIRMLIVALDGALNATVKVWIQTPTASRILAYDQAVGFHADYLAGSSATFGASPLSAVNDELELSLYPTGGLPEESAITVWIEASSASGGTLAKSYIFGTATTSPPVIDEVLWISTRRARIRFRDEMLLSDSPNGLLHLQLLAGAVEYLSPSTVKITNLSPLPSWVGLWASFTGSAYVQNNGYFKISAVDTVDRTLTLVTSRDFKADNGTDLSRDGSVARERSLRGVISPFVLSSDYQQETDIVCSYEPVVVASRAPNPEEIPAGAEIKKYAIVDFHDDISYGRLYSLYAIGPENTKGLAADGAAGFQFTTPTFGRPNTRINLWDLWSDPDREEDLQNEGRLRRMSIVLQDILDVAWNRADMLEQFWDSDTTSDQMLPFLLYTLGNPFRFPLTNSRRRKLVGALSTLYKRAGSNLGIQEALIFFFGKQFTVRSLLDGFPWWEVGTSRLGVTSMLGPSTAYARNCYEVVAHETLTADDRRIVREIATELDAAYMHLLRIVEPASHVIVPTYWILGWSQLGYTTVLAI